MDRKFAERFALEWIAAWNSHDLGRILAHYTDDFEMASPVIRRLGHAADGRLRGKAAVGAYWRAALDANPALHFERVATLTGADSLTLLYRGATGQMVAEVMAFDESGKVRAASAHYGGATAQPDEEVTTVNQDAPVAPIVSAGATAEPAPRGDAATLLAVLRDRPLPDRPRRTREQIDADIESERDSWE